MAAAPQTPFPGGDALARLTWQDFEHGLAEYYRDQGYTVERHGVARPLQATQGGMDLRLRRGSETVVVGSSASDHHPVVSDLAWA